MKRLLFSIAFTCYICLVFGQTNNSYTKFPILKGEYLGQTPPNTTAELFAPNIISNGLVNRDVTISPDGKEMYFSTYVRGFKYSTIVFSKQINGVWTKPEAAPFATNPKYSYIEPMFSCDGKKLFFVSENHSDKDNNIVNKDIWVMNRINDKWEKPTNIGAPINTNEGEFFPSFTNDGAMYFTRDDKKDRVSYIFRSNYINGKYTTPTKLPKQINCGADRFNAFVAPDESFVLISAVGVEEDIRGVNYYIVFRNNDDTWSEPINLGNKINAPRGNGWSIYMSPDVKYIFFMATRGLPSSKRPTSISLDFLKNLSTMPENGNADIYWISAKVIEKLKKSVQESK